MGEKRGNVKVQIEICSIKNVHRKLYRKYILFLRLAIFGRWNTFTFARSQIKTRTNAELPLKNGQ